MIMRRNLPNGCNSRAPNAPLALGAALRIPACNGELSAVHCQRLETASQPSTALADSEMARIPAAGSISCIRPPGSGGARAMKRASRPLRSYLAGVQESVFEELYQHRIY